MWVKFTIRKKDQHKTLQKKQEKKRERTENQFLEFGFLFAKKLGEKKKKT